MEANWIVLIGNAVVLMFTITDVTGRTQSDLDDDCPGCSGYSCSSDITYLNVTSYKQSLTSPNYPHNYPNNELCRWVLKTHSKVYAVRISIITIEIASDVICKQDYLLIQDGDGTYSPKYRTCCQDVCKDLNSVTSTSDALRITFRSDGFRTDKGFNVTYWSVPKNVKEVKAVQLGAINYVLFALFAGIVCSIIITSLLIIVVRSESKWIQRTSNKMNYFKNKHLNAKHIQQEEKEIKTIILENKD